MGPPNVPASASIAGKSASTSSGTPSSPVTDLTNTVGFRFDASARGVTALVIRADSSELGPDFTEFTSNAVTA